MNITHPIFRVRLEQGRIKDFLKFFVQGTIFIQRARRGARIFCSPYWAFVALPAPQMPPPDSLGVANGTAPPPRSNDYTSIDELLIVRWRTRGTTLRRWARRTPRTSSSWPASWRQSTDTSSQTLFRHVIHDVIQINNDIITVKARKNEMDQVKNLGHA